MFHRLYFRLLTAILFLSACATTSSKMNPDAENQKPLASFFALNHQTLDGKPFAFEQLKGKITVLVNTASKCGYTPQYKDLEAFYAKHKDRIVVLGFPSNQFMMQEPGDNADIATFCEKNYGVTFPMFDKSDVKGKDKSPVYDWLTNQKLNGWNTQEPSWNFCKYIVNENGELVSFFPSDVLPTDPAFMKAVGL
jgi:glutathione peroxidase